MIPDDTRYTKMPRTRRGKTGNEEKKGGSVEGFGGGGVGATDERHRVVRRGKVVGMIWYACTKPAAVRS